MPMEMVSFAISSGVGVSLVAGILSGVCYVLVYSKTSRKSNKKTIKAHSCAVCGEYFRSIDHILKGDSTVVCAKCQSKVCGQGCAREQQDEWICKNCLRPPETWFQGFLHSLQPSKIGDDGDEKDSVLTVGKERSSDNVKGQVQDFIEKLVNSMLGQNIDDATITKIFNDENYNQIFHKYHRDISEALRQLGTSLHSSIAHLPLSGQQSPCTAHAALKQLIEKLLLEVLHMPALQQPQDSTISTSNAKDKTYEDLLATAILNKVISNSQARPSSSAASVSSRLSNNSNYKEDKEYFFGEETLDNKWRQADLESTSASSLEDWLQTDSSFGSRKFVDRVTLTIKQNIEDLSQASDSDEDDRFDDSEYFTTKSAIWSDDEPNWFLQKRHFQAGTHSPVPVPMLVPNPTTEAKVLIGDKEVDETSDLSDVESEFGDTEIVPTRHSVLVDSKSVIGGKNILQNGVGRGGESGSESSVDSGVKEVGRNQSQYDTSDFAENLDNDSVKKTQNYTENIHKTDIHVDDDNVEEETSLLSNYSNTEQEAEYIEYFSASLPRKVENKPLPSARPSLHTPKQSSKSKNENYLEREYAFSDGDLTEFSGRYSKREKEKWKNAVEMKNNPYSKENIEQRIKRSNSGVSSVFGPDYYAKLASSPSGTKSKSPKTFEEKPFTPHVVADKRESSAPEEKNIYRAEPIIVDEVAQNGTEELQKYSSDTSPSMDENQKPTETESNSNSIQYVAEISSDSDLSYINCYDVTKSQVYKKTVDTEPTAQKISFVKNAKSQKQHKLVAKPAAAATTYELKRHKSESDLYDLDETPKVLPRKKDNTLISKIYKSLSKSDLSEYPTFRTQLSTPEMHYFHNDNNNSFSSQDVEISNDIMTITKTMLLSSEDDYSDGTAFIRRPKVSNNYSSSEEPLSFEETDRFNSISKGHKPLQARNSALVKPAGAGFAKNDAKSIDQIDGKPTEPVLTKEHVVLNERNGVNDSDVERIENMHSEVDELAKKRIVHNILDKLNGPRSKSNGAVSRESANENVESNEEIKMSVKELMKKFEANSGKSQVISSLTARSLSRHTKELLRE